MGGKTSLKKRFNSAEENFGRLNLRNVSRVSYKQEAGVGKIGGPCFGRSHRDGVSRTVNDQDRGLHHTERRQNIKVTERLPNLVIDELLIPDCSFRAGADITF